MKLLEALNSLDENKMVKNKTKSGTLVIYRKKNGTIEVKFGDEDWRIADIAINDNWEIYEEPEKKIKSSKFIFTSSTVHTVDMNVLIISYENVKESDAWHQAMETFFEMKSHPLVAEMSEDWQYIVRPSRAIDSIKVARIIADSYAGESTKLEGLSPLFSSKEEAERMIEGIGEERLLHMFRTFQGIYE